MKPATKEVVVTLLKYLATAIAAVLGTLGVTSCGVTRASIVQPKDGSTTSITITTNNPITTTVNPATDVDFLNKP